MKPHLLPSIFYLLPLVAFAHEGELIESHPEAAGTASDVASVDPLMAGGVLLGVAVIGFLVWKFILKK